MSAKNMLFSGFGGQGILFAGKFIAYKGLIEEKQVSWLPSYGPEMRGGTASCSVIVSDTPVGSPIVSNPDILVAMNLPSLDRFESKVTKGGMIFADSTLIERKVERDDITVVYCDSSALAESVGNPKGANVAILGAMMSKDNIVDIDKMMEAIRIELGEKKVRFLEGNKKALIAGMEAAK